MKHKIILPDLPGGRNSRYMIVMHSRCLLSLPAFNEDITVVCSNKLLQPYVSEILSGHVHMANKNGEIQGLFVVNDQVFMIINTDFPIHNYENWIPYYSKYVSGFFVACQRYSTNYIYDDCSVPVFQMGICPDRLIPMHFLEHNGHSKSMTCEKNISVFFQGRYNTRVSRKSLAKYIQQNIPHTQIQNSHTVEITGKQYVDFMCRSKIAWCPRSVWSEPDPEENVSTGKEGDAMSLEIMVIKPPNGTTEIEERIPGVHFVEYKNDNSDLIEKLQYYLDHDDERKEIAHNGRLWWERNCSTIARAKNIFLNCLSAMNCNYKFWKDK